MARRKVYEEIAALFDYNPPTTTLSEESGITFSYPNVFYDRHLDPRLCLKHIKAAPSLSLELSKLVEDELITLKSRGQPLPFLRNEGCCFVTENNRKTYPPRTTIWDAESVAQFYSRASYKNCAPVASTIALYPYGEAWYKILDFCEGSELERGQHPAMIDNYILQISHRHETGELTTSKAISSCLKDDLRQDIRAMSDRFRTLAAFQFHVPSIKAEDLFRDMGVVAKWSRLPLLQCPTVGLVVSQNALPYPLPDSLATIKSLPCIMAPCASTQAARRSTRLSSRSEGRSESVSSTGREGQTSRTKVKAWPTLNVKPTKVSRPNSLLFIQRAWTRAVQYDATLIVFNCGNYERIGFRHRDSQTLYLSDLIDVSECFEPGYGQIQIGLYMAILRDALDRIRHQVGLEAESTTTKAKRKRSNDAEYADANRESKRPRTRLTTSGKQMFQESPEDMHSLVLCETDCRDVVLLWFKYGVFNSPEPAVLHRVGRSSDGQPRFTTRKERKYRPEDYFRLTLTSEVAEGATGKVHDAKIEVQASDCRVYSCEGVVKIALGNKEREKLRHEYAVYRHMMVNKVNHVVSVYGLFEDAANEATVLAMSHAGTSLAEQPHYIEHGQVSLTEEQKEAFITAMREIHQAGVRHYDIRPNNLMMDDQGRATIIDFDMAKVKAGKRSRQREFEHLGYLLDESYDPPNQWESPPTSPSARFPPADDDIIYGRIY